jgi:hypothetical protein
VGYAAAPAPVGYPPSANPQPAPAYGYGPPAIGNGYGPPPGYGPVPVGYYPPARQQGWPTAAKVAIGTVAGLIALAILAAVAIPVFLQQSQKPANRPVAVPATLFGDSQLHTADLDSAVTAALADFDQPGSPWGTPQGAYFGQDDGPLFFVGAAKLTRRLLPDEQAELFREGATAGTVLSAQGSGPYGGRMECGSVTRDGASGIDCFSYDSAAVVITVVFNSTPSQAAILSRQLIGAVEGQASAATL